MAAVEESLVRLIRVVTLWPINGPRRGDIVFWPDSARIEPQTSRYEKRRAEPGPGPGGKPPKRSRVESSRY